MKKGSMKTLDYCKKMKRIADKITVAGFAILEKELVMCILTRLGPEYETVYTNYTSRPPLPSLQEDKQIRITILKGILEGGLYKLQIPYHHSARWILSVVSEANTIPEAQVRDQLFSDSNNSFCVLYGVLDSDSHNHVVSGSDTTVCNSEHVSITSKNNIDCIPHTVAGSSGIVPVTNKADVHMEVLH
ncbi:uncharacterized protein LOC112493124 isoform X2 [Ziziphus jujuba]|uniref:Uncharacterized protein LOC112493124 isoform X2 n=1 Tax=Ziziphus jujuba TaxID=326968 RepID=A0ABM3ZZ04_ZIZJJ|nr:uncharacterized protein LOC112493124 isoform X2 [Ziziphus jujuba]